MRAGRHGVLVREQFEAARRAPAGRAARTVVGGHENVMRQTVIALLGGRSLAGHESPVRPACACWAVGSGSSRVRPRGTTRGETSSSCWPGPHSLESLEDAAVPLTVAEIDKQVRHAKGRDDDRQGGHDA